MYYYVEMESDLHLNWHEYLSCQLLFQVSAWADKQDNLINCFVVT